MAHLHIQVHDAAEEIHPDERKIRECLKCGRKMVSTWFGNRICSRCSSHDESTSIRVCRVGFPYPFHPDLRVGDL